MLEEAEACTIVSRAKQARAEGIDAAASDTRRVLVEFNETIYTDPRAEHVMRTLQDGVFLSLKPR